MSAQRLLAADRLPARESGPWIHQKYALLDRYARMFTTGMKGRHDNFPRGLAFVDLMSGPGICIDTRSPGRLEWPGSTLRALSASDPFKRVIAVDSNPEFIDALTTRTAMSPRRSSFECWSDDCNSSATVEKIRDLIYGHLTLMFVDLLGTEVHMATIRALTDNRGVDLVITWPEMDVVRNRGQLFEQPQRWDAFFGTNAWRAIAATGPLFRVRNLRALYCRQLERIGYETQFADPVKNLRGGRLYRPLFASRHDLGLKFWSIAAAPRHPQPGLPL